MNTEQIKRLGTRKNENLNLADQVILVNLEILANLMILVNLMNPLNKAILVHLVL